MFAPGGQGEEDLVHRGFVGERVCLANLGDRAGDEGQVGLGKVGARVSTREPLRFEPLSDDGCFSPAMVTTERRRAMSVVGMDDGRLVMVVRFVR